MELFSDHLPSFKKVSTEHSEEHEMVVDYYNEFMKIISDAKVNYTRDTLLSSDRDKVKEIIKSSGNLSEILSTIKNKKTEADRKRSKRNKLLLTIAVVLSVAAGIAYYFLK